MEPTQDEIQKWMRDTLRHVCHVEYFLNQFNRGKEDPERPHDSVGINNKFEWEVMKRFALQYRMDEALKPLILEAREMHRQQYHHKMWNDYNPNATIDGMKVGAMDAVCSLLENRSYQGGNHTYEEILELIRNNPIHKVAWFNLVIPEMKGIIQPNLELITNVREFPNIGIREDLYEKLKQRMQETVQMLEGRGYKI
ncbi:hypothetical protein HZA97_03955 [Candidatus Woesearchaeota archaeon]|nr:hypothetical protein [Candidatus Woesearchaeota archaeon]